MSQVNRNQRGHSSIDSKNENMSNSDEFVALSIVKQKNNNAKLMNLRSTKTASAHATKILTLPQKIDSSQR